MGRGRGRRVARKLKLQITGGAAKIVEGTARSMGITVNG
jgi:ribosomal protein L11